MVHESQTDIIVIAGPTATGKSAYGMELALAFDGEIVCVDSRTIYRGMDIGTAKPSEGDRQKVRHHLLDLLQPDEGVSAVWYRDQIVKAVDEIHARKHLPILVGGSGLYLDAYLYNYQFPAPADPNVRRQLMQRSSADLAQLLAALDSSMASRTDAANKRRLIRAIETVGQPRTKQRHVSPSTLVIGIRMSSDIARDRIRNRAEQMLRTGILDEIERLGSTYGWESPLFNVVGYGPFRELAKGELNSTSAVEQVVAQTMNLYRKQLTWFKRNESILWVDSLGEAQALVTELLRS